MFTSAAGPGNDPFAKSRYCNTFKVSQVGRGQLAISSFRQALLADHCPPQFAIDFVWDEASLPLSGYGRLPWRCSR